MMIWVDNLWPNPQPQQQQQHTHTPPPAIENMMNTHTGTEQQQATNNIQQTIYTLG